MRKHITANTNRFAHQLRKAYPSMTWGEAFRTALLLGARVECGSVQANTSVFGQWTLESQHSVAGHFWALNKLYTDSGELGRAITFKRVAQTLYALTEQGIRATWSEILLQKGWKESVRKEMIECFICGIDSIDTTERMMTLITELNPTHPIKYPNWRF